LRLSWRSWPAVPMQSRWIQLSNHKFQQLILVFRIRLILKPILLLLQSLFKRMLQRLYQRWTVIILFKLWPKVQLTSIISPVKILRKWPFKLDLCNLSNWQIQLQPQLQLQLQSQQSLSTYRPRKRPRSTLNFNKILLKLSQKLWAWSKLKLKMMKIT